MLLERSVRRINELDREFGLRLVTRYSTIEILEEECATPTSWSARP